MLILSSGDKSRYRSEIGDCVGANRGSKDGVGFVSGDKGATGLSEASTQSK